MSYDQDSWLWRRYFEGSQHLRDVLEKELKVSDNVSFPDFNIMLLLYEAPSPMSMGEIAERLVFLPSRLTYTVRSLQQRDLVKQQISEQDRRVQLVELTPRGRAVFEKARVNHRDAVERHFLDLLSEEEARILEKIFSRYAKRSGAKGSARSAQRER